MYFFAKYIRSRVTNPLAWLIGFGATGILAGGRAGFEQGGWEDAVVGAFVGGAIGALVGSSAGIPIWLISRYLKRAVRRPSNRSEDGGCNSGELMGKSGRY